MSSARPNTGEKCRLVEILQYECTPAERGSPPSPPTCFPLPRTFRLCPGQPAVELTAYARVNRVDGVLMIPEDYMNLKPKARPWKDILRERDES